jgi:hypothetical protein
MVLSNKKIIIFLILLIFLIFLIFFYKSLEDKKNIQITFKLYDNFYISKLKNTNIPSIESASITLHKNKNYLTGGYINTQSINVSARSNLYYIQKNEIEFDGPYQMNIPALNGHCTVSFKEKLYLIGGYQQAHKVHTNDIYIFSENNKVGFLPFTRAPFPPRSFYGCVHFKNGILIFGGITNNNKTLGDVWFSNDMYNWKKLSTNFPQRSMFSYYERDGVVYIKGGGAYDDRLPFNGTSNDSKEILFTKDGIYWTAIPGNIKKTRFEGFAELENYFFSIGGYSSDFPDFLALNLKEMHISKDGETWKKLPEIAQFSARHAPNIYKYKNAIYILGGNDGRIFSDLWKIEKKSKLNMIIFGE